MTKTGILLLTLSLFGVVLGVGQRSQAKYGYTVFEGVGMYRLGTEPTPAGKVAWSEAFQSCLNDGGHLAIVNSEEEARVLKEFIEPTNSTFLYIGFSDLYTEGVYLTVHGIPLEQTGYHRWYNGIPNGGASTNCGAVNRDIELSDQGCNNTFSYICEMPLWKNYEFVPDFGYYSFETFGLTWANAVRKCDRDGAHLLIIDSEGEALIAHDLYAAHPALPNVEDPNYIQIGIQDLYKEGLYLTLKGDTLSGNYTTWAPGEPVANATLNTARMDRNGLISIFNGQVAHAYICEHEL